MSVQASSGTGHHVAHRICANFLYGFKAARRAARAAGSARSPLLPLALPLRRRQRRSAGAKTQNRAAMTYAVTEIQLRGGVRAPAAEIVRGGQNPSRPSVTAVQPHRRNCRVNVHAKTALTEPARQSRSSQLSGAWARVAKTVGPVDAASQARPQITFACRIHRLAHPFGEHTAPVFGLIVSFTSTSPGAIL